MSVETLWLGNFLSGFGGVLLLSGYFILALRQKEKLSILLNGMGSLLMCFAFYIFKSNAFFLLNVIWVFISIQGISKRKTNITNNSDSFIFHVFLILLMLYSLILVFQSGYELMSWVSITLMLVSYYLFSLKIFSSYSYIYYSSSANLIALFYLWNIQNYGSFIQTIFSIGISIYSLREGLKSKEQMIEENCCTALN